MTAANLITHSSRLKNAVQALHKRSVPIRYAILHPQMPRPIIYVRRCAGLTGLVWTRYAWGVDEYGRFERWTAVVQDCQLKWEVRPNG